VTLTGKRLAFIGGGNMASAIIGGLLRQGQRPFEDQPDQRLRGASVLIDHGRVVTVGTDIAAPAAVPFDLHGLLLVPGFIDIHVHGGGGHSLTASHVERLLAYAKWAPRHGVTGFLAGTIGPSAASIERALQRGSGLVERISEGA